LTFISGTTGVKLNQSLIGSMHELVDGLQQQQQPSRIPL